MSAAKTTILEQLPDDIDSLKKIIADQAVNYENLLKDKDSIIADRNNIITKRNQTITLKEQRIHQLEEYLRLAKVKRFAASSEKSVDQQEMFNEAELSVVAEEILTEQAVAREAAAAAAKPKKRPGRKPLPAELPRIRVEHSVSDSELRCPCGCERVVIGEECSEQLDIIPAKIQVLVHVRKKYACKQCEAGVITAPRPPQPIPKSNASPGTLAHIATAKYVDGVPLHRQEAVLNRSGIDIPRNTLAQWMIKSGELIQPLINLLQDHLLTYPVIQSDETGVQVLNEPDKPPISKSYMWVRVGGPPLRPIRLFHYADSRKGEVATQLFDGYQGYLQTDDYAGYNTVGKQSTITHLGCWAHARRKFVDAQKANNSKNQKSGKADVAVSLIAKLYRVESEIKGLTPEEKYTRRQQEAIPTLNTLRTWLDKTLHSTLPKGLLGQALAYLDKNWGKLNVYTQDGRLNIDNNNAENAIRPFVIGRKNWLFSASVKGAKASANLYSLIETAKANGREPYTYLCHVFKELPKAESVDELEMLLPWNANMQTITAE